MSNSIDIMGVKHFAYWIIVKAKGKFYLAGTQRLPVEGGDNNTATCFIPFLDDFFTITNADIFFTVQFKQSNYDKVSHEAEQELLMMQAANTVDMDSLHANRDN